MTSTKIYYVEDDRDDAALLTQVFLEKGYEIRVFPDPVELFHGLHADEMLPTLIILDLNLPLMTGSEALALLNDEPKFHRIPVAILSTSPRSGSGVDDKELYFVKPAQFHEYDAIVAHLLDHAAAPDSETGAKTMTVTPGMRMDLAIVRLTEKLRKDLQRGRTGET